MPLQANQRTMLPSPPRAPSPSPAPGAAPLAELATGPWQHVTCLHDGSTTAVYAVRPAGSEGKPVYALKRLQPFWASDSQAVAHLHGEARVASQVNHRNLIPVLSANLESPPIYLITPLLEGQTLEQWLAPSEVLTVRTPARGGVTSQPALPSAQALQPSLAASLWFVRQAAEALQALHQGGWMHGDVKPSNLFLSPSGHLTLIDLGFACQPSAGNWAPDRPSGGTPYYLAPETVVSKLRPDIRSDLYSLGVVFYRLLSGRLPFEGSSSAEVIQQQLQGKPRPLRDLAPQVPADVADLVHRLLAKEPLRRPSHPQTLVDELVQLELAHFACR